MSFSVLSLLCLALLTESSAGHGTFKISHHRALASLFLGDELVIRFFGKREKQLANGFDMINNPSLTKGAKRSKHGDGVEQTHFMSDEKHILKR